MRGLFKKTIIAILSRKLRTAIQAAHAKVIVIIGSQSRSIFRDEIADSFIASGAETARNIPGYNYRLGIPLSILGLGTGYSSVFNWIQILFKPIQKKLPTTIVVEFAFQQVDDAHYVADVLQASAVVVSDITPSPTLKKGSTDQYAEHLVTFLKSLPASVKLIVPKELQIGEREGLYRFGTDAGAEIIVNRYTEGETGSTYSVTVIGENAEESLHTFGIHYVYAHAVARALKKIHA